jgi:hypothetical protein
MTYHEYGLGDLPDAFEQVNRLEQENKELRAKIQQLEALVQPRQPGGSFTIKVGTDGAWGGGGGK